MMGMEDAKKAKKKSMIFRHTYFDPAPNMLRNSTVVQQSLYRMGAGKSRPSRHFNRLNCFDMSSSESGSSEESIAEYGCAVICSRRWEAEVMSFVDEHCIVFVDDDENKIEHTRLHGEYKDLVERVLRQRLSEVGISKDDFVRCEKSLHKRKMKKAAIEQLAARDDFAVFTQMMSRRNKELEQELRKVIDADQQQAEGQSTREAAPAAQQNNDCSNESNIENDACDSIDSHDEGGSKTPLPDFSIKQEDIDAYEYVEDEQLRLLFAATNKILASPETKNNKTNVQNAKPPPPPNSPDGENPEAGKEAHLRKQRDLLVAKKRAERESRITSPIRNSQPKQSTKDILPRLSPQRRE